MNLIKKGLLFLITSFLIQCEKDSSSILGNQGDYLIFGYFYGECIGEGCMQNYKLTSTELFRDTTPYNYAGNSPFSFEVMDSESFEKVKLLKEAFPRVLLTLREDRFGCPDCADQGGLLIEYGTLNKKQRWTIDQRKNDVPEFLHEFIDEVNKSINRINN